MSLLIIIALIAVLAWRANRASSRWSSADIAAKHGKLKAVLWPREKAMHVVHTAMATVVRGSMVGINGETLIPNVVTVALNTSDYALAAQVMTWFTAQIVESMRKLAARDGWRLVGDPEVRIVESAGENNAPRTTVAFREPTPQTQVAMSATAKLPDITSFSLYEAATGRDLQLEDGDVLGRSSDCDLRILDAKVSGLHAAFTIRTGGPWIEDLDSKNGTWVNGERTESCRLTAGDIVNVGGSTLRLDSDNPEGTRRA